MFLPCCFGSRIHTSIDLPQMANMLDTLEGKRCGCSHIQRSVAILCLKLQTLRRSYRSHEYFGTRRLLQVLLHAHLRLQQ